MKDTSAKRAGAAALFFISLALLSARLLAARDTGFWCDELAWIRESMMGLGDAIENVRREPGPLGPLDLVLIAAFGKPLILFGVHPHIAVRFATVFFAVLTGALAFGATTLSKKEKWAWFLWTATNVSVNSMSITARPYAGMIFFSSCALFAGIELARARKPGPYVWSLLALLAASGFSHPYLLLAVLALMGVLAARGDRRTSRDLWLALGLAVALKVVWYAVLREPVGFPAVPLPRILENAATTPWRRLTSEALHAFWGPGAPLKLAMPFVAAGAVILAFRGRTEFLFVVGTGVAAVLAPIALNLRYDYSFAARQTFVALPFWGWLVTTALARTAEAPLRIGVPVVALFVVLGVALPLRHWARNAPPYVDMPRYKLHDLWRNRDFKDRDLLVLSYCHLESANLYASIDRFDSYFSSYGRSEPPPLSAPPKNVVTWTRQTASCFGLVPEHPDDPRLLEKIRTSPQRYAVLAPFNVPLPPALRDLPCRTETDQICLPPL